MKTYLLVQVSLLFLKKESYFYQKLKSPFRDLGHETPQLHTIFSEKQILPCGDGLCGVDAFF
jgi:hypothetical protein